MKYTYTISEYSQDTRTWELSSDVKLTEEWINDNLGELCDVNQSTPSLSIHRNKDEDRGITIGKLEVYYSGTEYGEDTQVDISGDFAKEADIK